jgi:L-lactate dehydrogenase complex protein LldF
MKTFGIGASSPSLFEIATKSLPILAKPLVKDDKISKGPGPIKEWTKVKDLPAPGKDNFRTWFKEHTKGGRNDDKRNHSSER